VLDVATQPHTAVTNMNELNYRNIVGEKVRALRRSAGLSQESLAQRCGIFRTYLSRIESGAANPSLVVLVTLAAALEVEPHVLLIMGPSPS
jgi:transcriptional regulator with XRE-family HTH domain